MKLVSELTVIFEKGSLADLIKRVESSGCAVARFEQGEGSSGEQVTCILEVVYSDRSRFAGLIKELSKKQGNYILKEVSSSMEAYMKEGLLEVSGRIPLEKISDYETSLLGATELIQERIQGGSHDVTCGIDRNIVQVVGCHGDDPGLEDELLKQYCLAQSDGIVLSRFTPFNPYPLISATSQGEDIIRVLKNVEKTYGAARIVSLMDAGLSVYEQLSREVSIPVVFREFDEIPVYLLSMILRMAMKHHLEPEETTIGIVGINLSAIRLTRLLKRCHFSRVLGYDTAEKILLNFENEGGLATTTENIFSHTDIVIILSPLYSDDDIRFMRPGQFILSVTSDSPIDVDILKEQGVRDVVQGDIYDLSRIFPGLISGVMEHGIMSLDDSRLTEVARKLGNLLTEDYQFPDLFGPVHTMVADFLDPSVMLKK